MPPPVADPLETVAGLAAYALATLLASRRAVDPQVTDGITTGPGNQGTAAFIMTGQAGTASSQLSIPRNLRFGNTASAIP